MSGDDPGNLREKLNLRLIIYDIIDLSDEKLDSMKL